MIRKIVRTVSGRGDTFYRVTLPKNMMELLNWHRLKKLSILATNKHITLSNSKGKGKQVTITKSTILKRGRSYVRAYYFIIPIGIVKKFKIVSGKSIKYELKNGSLVLTVK